MTDTRQKAIDAFLKLGGSHDPASATRFVAEAVDAFTEHLRSQLPHPAPERCGMPLVAAPQAAYHCPKPKGHEGYCTPVPDSEAPAPKAEGLAAIASAACPICGRETPHAHFADDIERWCAGQVARWGFDARVFPLGGALPHADRCGCCSSRLLLSRNTYQWCRNCGAIRVGPAAEWVLHDGDPERTSNAQAMAELATAAPKAEGGEVSDEERECPRADCCQNEPCSGPGTPNLAELVCEYEAADSSDGPAQQHQNGLADVWNLGKGHGFRAGRASLAAELEAARYELAETSTMLKRNQEALHRLAAVPAVSARITVAAPVATAVDAAIAELAEKDRRIAAWEPVVRALSAWRGRLPKICSPVTSGLTPVVCALADAYDAIPVELRPGGKS
jgi:hypothetical protein